LLAVLMILLFQHTSTYIQQLYVGPWIVLGSVIVNILELLVAALQAYIFTFLTAMFLGLYTGGGH
jgi:F-type H+-transporting ATPase subunit a